MVMTTKPVAFLFRFACDIILEFSFIFGGFLVLRMVQSLKDVKQNIQEIVNNTHTTEQT